MAATLPLGLDPVNVPVILSRDGAFVANITNKLGDWPDGTEIELWFIVDKADLTTPIVWTATIDGPLASWNVEAMDCSQVIHDNAKNVRLHYNTLLWGIGKVTVK